jgi:hypothetical protein
VRTDLVTRRTEQRRLAAVAAAALAVIVASTVAPVDSEAAPVASPVGIVVHQLGAPLPPIAAVKPAPVRPTVSRTAARTSTTRAATVAPYRVGTPSYSKWWARRIMTQKYHWSSTAQYQCLVRLWQRESNWLSTSYNRGSGATGIPQAVPGSKMRSSGADWRTNPVTQIRWGLGYIKQVYGSPCGAWSHSQARGWY